MAKTPEQYQEQEYTVRSVYTNCLIATRSIASALKISLEGDLPETVDRVNAVLATLFEMYPADTPEGAGLVREIRDVIPLSVIEANYNDLHPALTQSLNVFDIFHPETDFSTVVASERALTHALSNPEFTQKAFQLSSAGVESHNIVLQEHHLSLPRIAKAITQIAQGLRSQDPRLVIEFDDLFAIWKVQGDEERNIIDQDTRIFIFELLMGMGRRVRDAEATDATDWHLYFNRALAVLGMHNSNASQQDSQASLKWDSFKQLDPESPATQRFVRAARSLDHAIQVVPEVANIIRRRLGKQQLYADESLLNKLKLSNIDLNYWFLAYMGLASLTVTNMDNESLKTLENPQLEEVLLSSPNILQRSLISFFLPHQYEWDQSYSTIIASHLELLQNSAQTLRVLVNRIPSKLL